MIGARVVERSLGLISTAILARALTPADFGLVAMALAIVAVIEVFSAFGFDWAVVRQPAATREHYDSAWTLRLIVSFGVVLALIAVAYPTATFYRHPELVGIILVMAVSTLVGALENIWVVEYRRNFRFDREFGLRTAGKLAGFCVAVTVALVNHSYWALVLGTLASRVATTIASYLMHPGRPSFCLSRRRDLMSYSVWLMVGNVADLVRARFGEAFIGRVFGARSLGLYSVSAELANLATSEFAAPVNRVVFSRYAQIEGDTAALRRGFVRVSALIWAIGMPATIGIAAIAPQLVLLLLGDQWTQAAPLIQILTASGAVAVIGGNSAYVFWAMGKSRFVTAMSILGLIFFVLLTFLLVNHYGLLGVAFAQVLAGIGVVAINNAVLMWLIKLPLLEFLSGVWRVAMSAGLMGFAVWKLSALLESIGVESVAAQLVVLVSAGIGLYAILLGALWRLAGQPDGVETDVLAIIGSRIKNFRPVS
jgi:O-antigen/teichoic acid export membrane protein